MNKDAKRLLLMRHAKSSWEDERLTDFERPLNDRGRRAALRMGRLLREQKIQVDIVIASPAVRVKETLAGLLPEWQCAPEVIWEKALYLAPLERWLSTVAGLHDSWQSVLFVGHNPGLGQLLSHLSNNAQHLPTGSIALLETSAQSWPLSLMLRPWRQTAFWKPKGLES